MNRTRHPTWLTIIALAVMAMENICDADETTTQAALSASAAAGSEIGTAPLSLGTNCAFAQCRSLA
jgi:hypothetical protein